MIGKNNEVWEGLDQYGKECGSEKEAGEILKNKDKGSQRKEKDGNENIEGGNPKEADKKLEEENKWPCGVCKENVTDDGFECVVCKNWHHAGECTDTVSSSEFGNKPYTCKKCLEKSGGREKKTKADEKVKKRLGRPPQRDRSYSVPSSLSEDRKNRDRIAKNIESRRKRNINEVGSPGKAEVTLEEKKMKKDGEWTEKKEDGKKKVEEEEKLSPLKNLFNPLKRLFSSEEKGKKQKEKEEKEKDKQTEREQKEDRNKEKAKEKDEKNEGVEGGKKEKQKECTPPEKEKEEEKEEQKEKEKDKQTEREQKEEMQKEKVTENEEKGQGEGGKRETKKERNAEQKGKTKKLGQTGKTGISNIEYNGIKINNEDLKSIEGENWITITILDAFLARLEDTRGDILKNNNILLVQPNIAQIFQYGDRESIQYYKDHFKTKKYDWIFYPVSKTAYPVSEKLDGGIHWSLMVFSKNKHAFLHFDSIRGMNEKGAKKMAINMADDEDFNEKGQLPAFFSADCSRQDNNWACGAYLMHFMDRVITEIGEGRGNGIAMMRAMQCDVVKTRDKLRKTLEKLVPKEKEVTITYENVHIAKEMGEKKKRHR